jgi:GDP-4-dehydro-6-deoxy-D-mannose reductase
VQKTLLLIGARGFAGSHLLEAAGAADVRVVPAGREGFAGVPPCDLRDPAAVAACLDAVAPDLIVNAAGAASVAASWERPGEAFAANATGVLNLLEAVATRRPEAHLLCISSAEVYGEPGAEALPLSEGLEPRPVTPYGAAKAAMETLCGQYARGRGLRVAVVRAFNLFGPGQSQRFAASGFAHRVAEAELGGAAEVELALGNPAAARDFTDVRDAARALLEVSRRELCGTYNLCSGRALTIAELVAELSRLARLPVSARHDRDLERPADPAALVGDPMRLREATGFEPAMPLSQTLSDLLEWWRHELASA